MVSSICFSFLLLSVVCVHGDTTATIPVSDGSTLSVTSDTNTEPFMSNDTPVPSQSTTASHETTTSQKTTTDTTTTTSEKTTTTDRTTTTSEKTTTTDTTTTTSEKTTTTDTTTITSEKTTTTDRTITTSEKTTTTDTTTTTSQKTTTTSTTTTTTTPSGSSDDPAVVDWHVGSKRGVCLLLTTGIQLHVTYPVAANKTATAVLNVPSNGTSSGHCSSLETLNITYTAATVGNTTYNVSVSFTLDSNSTQSTYRLHSVNVSVPLVARLLPNISVDAASGFWRAQVNLTDEIPSLPMNTSYRCLSHRQFQLVADNRRRLSGHVVLVKTELEGFRRSNTTKFSPPLVCAADRQNTSDVVPIAVGVSLALLVVLILVGYLVAQRRNRRNQYQSI